MDNLFRVLNTESLNTLDGVDSIVKESLNMLCMAEGLPANEKRMHLNQLLMKYEAFLKKLYYLINHKELKGKEPGKDATLSSAIFGIPSLKKLKYSEDPEVKAFSDRLDILRQLRNDEAHGQLYCYGTGGRCCHRHRDRHVSVCSRNKYHTSCQAV